MASPTVPVLLAEAAGVGAVTTVVGMVIATPPMYWHKPRPTGGTLAAVAASLFATGVAVHLLMEATGLNRRYCRTYMART